MTPYSKFQKRIVKIEDQANRKRDLAIKELKKAQNVCLHFHVTHHPDPAGDTSESYHTCNYCGKEF